MIQTGDGSTRPADDGNRTMVLVALAAASFVGATGLAVWSRSRRAATVR